jgi:hypothetical protein
VGCRTAKARTVPDALRVADSTESSCNPTGTQGAVDMQVCVGRGRGGSSSRAFICGFWAAAASTAGFAVVFSHTCLRGGVCTLLLYSRLPTVIIALCCRQSTAWSFTHPTLPRSWGRSIFHTPSTPLSESKVHADTPQSSGQLEQ